jgi:hypothetical protein
MQIWSKPRALAGAKRASMISAILPLSAPLPTRRMQLSAGSPSTGRPNSAFSRKRTKTGRIQTMVRRLLIVHGRAPFTLP